MSPKKKPDSCSTPISQIECHSSKTKQKIQPFPSKGPLKNNTNKSLADIETRVANFEDRAYSYVLSSVKRNPASGLFEQRGCGPNFQGGILTLCTCKHQMRSRLTTDQWKDVWIAGFTSRTIYEEAHWLFYLAKIKAAYDSHADLWKSISKSQRNAKAAHLHFLGDVFKPKSQKLSVDATYSPRNYQKPEAHAHRPRPSKNGWHRDINYRHAVSRRRPPLLVADPKLTFMWTKPMIFLWPKHCRDYFTWHSLNELIDELDEESL